MIEDYTQVPFDTFAKSVEKHHGDVQKIANELGLQPISVLVRIKRWQTHPDIRKRYNFSTAVNFCATDYREHERRQNLVEKFKKQYSKKKRKTKKV